MIDASQAMQHECDAADLVYEIIGKMDGGRMSKLHFIVKMPKPTNKNTQRQWERVDEFFAELRLEIFEPLGHSDEDQEGGDLKWKAMKKVMRQNTSFKWDLVEEFPLCESCGQGSSEPINKEWYTWGTP
jgi:hypothetical protein